MKNKNLLQNIIYKYSTREFSKQTISGLFRSISEPILEKIGQDAFVAVRIKHSEQLASMVKRLKYSSAEIFSFSDYFNEEEMYNNEKEEIWGDAEFILVLAPRYSALLLWDYETGSLKDFSNVCLLYNSKLITDISKIIIKNSKINLESYLEKYFPDRRENELLNISINKFANFLNNINEENELVKAETDELVKAENKFKEYEFSSSQARFISHEIKNHLSIINLYSKIAEKRLTTIKCDKEVMDSFNNVIKNIQESSSIISQLINELKQVAIPILTEQKLDPIINNVVAMSTPKAQEKNIEISYFAKDIYRVRTDEIKLHSVILNIIYNSIEAIDKNGKIKIEAMKEDCNIKVLVTDNGNGILPEFQDKIFEQDFTTKITGNGLGLTICKNIMKELYGEINLVKSDSNGTTIEVLIPEA